MTRIDAWVIDLLTAIWLRTGRLCLRPVAAGSVFMVVGAIVCVGCSDSYQQETATVRGTITLDGQPLTSGSVMFVPDKGRGALAPIEADGTFTLGTYGDFDGAIVGRHKIAVYPPQAAGERNVAPPGARPIPQRYQSSETSQLEADVKAGEDNFVELKLVSQ